jgi:hypothetical protein
VDREHRDYLVPISAKVAPELAEAVRDLADAGDRSVSREIARAVREHVERSGGLASSRSPEPRIERRESSNVARQSNLQAPTGLDT